MVVTGLSITRGRVAEAGLWSALVNMFRESGGAARVARTVAASNRPGYVSVIPMVAVAPAGSVSAMVTVARWSTGTPYSSAPR